MSAVPSYFKDFLSNIRLSDNQVSDLKTGHTTLRKRLETDETLSKIIVSTFLQGSYRRSTAVKPKNGNKSDVDVIVVTKLDSEEYTPEEALDLFVPFLDKYYKGKYRIQGRSIGISLSYVDLDIVPTSAPSESETGILQDEAIISEYTIEDFQQNQLMKLLVVLCLKVLITYSANPMAKQDGNLSRSSSLIVRLRNGIKHIRLSKYDGQSKKI